ncbi:high-potential iron-sulfur protein [Cupriavidus sp. 30B13]|uniref:high-potential iron-sulfur protein n=1 Tax=Cupriavidus sp. 30B13 TaxID=3384241 RepID=UPI003B8FD323
MSTRRHFLKGIPIVAAAGALGLSLPTRAQGTGPMVDEKDPQAVGLGYKSDTTKVDKAKYPKHDATQHCGNCQLFQGKATDASGGCPLFAGKQVASKGWCSAWVKKA